MLASLRLFSNQIGFHRMVQFDSPKISDVLEPALSEVCRVSVLRQVNAAMQKIAWPVSVFPF